MYTKQTEVRRAFRDFARDNKIIIIRGKHQNDQPCDTRMAFVDFVNDLYDCKMITAGMAEKVTL